MSNGSCCGISNAMGVTDTHFRKVPRKNIRDPQVDFLYWRTFYAQHIGKSNKLRDLDVTETAVAGIDQGLREPASFESARPSREVVKSHHLLAFFRKYPKAGSKVFMYYLKYERRCCIGHTRTSRRRVIICLIQYRRECWKVLMIRIHLNVVFLQKW